MRWLATPLWLLSALAGGVSSDPRAQEGPGPWEMARDPANYALWRLPAGPAPADARFVEFEVRVPEGTLINAWARGAEPGGEAWSLAQAYTVFGSGWQRCLFPLSTFPGRRGWGPKSDAPLVTFPPSQCDDRRIPRSEVRLSLGDNRLAPDRLRSLELELFGTNGWTDPPRRETYAVRGIHFLARSPREELLAGTRLTVDVDLTRDLGPVNPIWKDACGTSKSFQQLGQRLYKVFGAASFGPSYPPQKGPDGPYNWLGVDAQVNLARQAAPLIQIVIGRDVPPWLWQPGGDAPGSPPWKLGHMLPPTSYPAYEEIVYQLARHIHDHLQTTVPAAGQGRGPSRVHSYVVWGGANATGYFRGSMDDYCRVYAACARAIRRADPEAKVGGPSPDPYFDPDWVQMLIRYCGENDVPLDFVSLHNYSVYADQSRLAAAWTRAELQRYPRLRNAEIHFDEWNSGFALGPLFADAKRSVMNAAYAAATFGEMTAGGVAYACYAAPDEGWAIFGTRLEEDDGTPRPIGNVFRLFSRLAGRRCGADVQPPDSGLGAFAATDGTITRIALWGYAPEQQPSSPPLRAQIEVTLSGLPGPPGPRTVHIWSVDSTHSNLAAGRAHAALEALPDTQVQVTGGRAVLRLPAEVPSVMLLEVRP